MSPPHSSSKSGCPHSISRSPPWKGNPAMIFPHLNMLSRQFSNSRLYSRSYSGVVSETGIPSMINNKQNRGRGRGRDDEKEGEIILRAERWRKKGLIACLSSNEIQLKPS
ncbi:hypothetical protein V6Z12_D11G184700 [Gossypium hirsutum]